MLATLSLCVAAVFPGEESSPPPARAATPTTCIRYFSLEGELSADALRDALAELTTPDARCQLVSGPVSSAPRPKQHFVALEVPTARTAKDIARSLKKHCSGVDELVWSSFRGGSTSLPTIMGQSPRDCVIGMASDLRWFIAEDDAKHFFYVAKKLDGAGIASRFHTLFAPFGAGDVGTLARDTRTFALADPVDGAALKRATKALEKQNGVRKVEAQGASITIEIELDGLHASAAAPSTAGAGARSNGLVQPAFDESAVRAALAQEKLLPRER